MKYGRDDDGLEWKMALVSMVVMMVVTMVEVERVWTVTIPC